MNDETVANLALPSSNGGSFEITFTVPFMQLGEKSKQNMMLFKLLKFYLKSWNTISVLCGTFKCFLNLVLAAALDPPTAPFIALSKQQG